MPATRPSATTWGLNGKMTPIYWDSVFGENLYPSLFFYGFGAKRKVPPNYGLTIKITRLKKQTGIVGAQAATSYGSPLTYANAAQLCAETISGTLAKYRGVYGNSDIALLTSLGDPTEFAIRDLARDLALQIDNAHINILSGVSQGRFLGGSTATYGNVRDGSVLKVSDIYKAVALLRSVNNPRWPDGCYPMILHPLVTYDLKATLSTGYAGAWQDINAYNTGDNVEKVYRGEIGKIGGMRFCESSNIKSITTTGALSGGSGAVSPNSRGFCNFVLAPEAFYTVEMDQMGGRVIVKGLGSAGALDADNSLSTVAAKVFFVPIRGFQSSDPNAAVSSSVEFRHIRLWTGSTLGATAA